MDIKSIASKVSDKSLQETKVVEGRELHLDADFLCYHVVDLGNTVAVNYQHMLRSIDYHRRKVGATHVNVMITPDGKTARDKMATVKVYQDERSKHRDPAVSHRVKELRNMLMQNGTVPNGVVVCSSLYEADDLLCMYQYKTIGEKGVDKSVLMSGDKDLWMVKGLHADQDTGKITMYSGYGNTAYKEVGNVKPKLVGTSTSWFWHQMIMGDKADNIPGLPALSPRLADEYLPLKSSRRKPDSKPLAAGEAKAVAVLKGVTNDKEAAYRVWNCYREYYGEGYKEMFIEQAYLLWMQRSNDPEDLLNFLWETCNLAFTFTKRQQKVIDDFKKEIEKEDKNAIYCSYKRSR